MIKRLQEAVGIGTPDNYASKAMDWLGNKFLLDRAEVGLNDEFYWDQDDRTPLKGGEVQDPKMQRLYCGTDDFRRKFTFGVARFMRVPVIAFSTLIILTGFAITAVFGPSDGREMATGETPSRWSASSSPRSMTDAELIAAARKMKAEGRTADSITPNDRAILQEINRRNL